MGRLGPAARRLPSTSGRAGSPGFGLALVVPFDPGEQHGVLQEERDLEEGALIAEGALELHADVPGPGCASRPVLDGGTGTAP